MLGCSLLLPARVVPMSTELENFGDRPQKLIACFERLDKLGARKLPMPLMEKLLTKFPDFALTTQEMEELRAEADTQGYMCYDDFVKKVIFGKIK